MTFLNNDDMTLTQAEVKENWRACAFWSTTTLSETGKKENACVNYNYKEMYMFFVVK